MAQTKPYDVIVVGAGPAGSVMAWALAREGVRVVILERARFPREKVCGDYIEPAGLRILAAMGALERIDDPAPLPIDATRVYCGPHLAYRGEIPYYPAEHGLPTHGRVVPRHELDLRLLERARAAGAETFEDCQVMDVVREGGTMAVTARLGNGERAFRAPLVVGADGTESIVGRRLGLRHTDKRTIGLSQRAYVEGVTVEGGEATVWFDDDLTPGYGWMFPMPGGRANIGVGLGSEACERHGLSPPKSFAALVRKLRLAHEGCADIRLTSRPLGGVVKTYGGIDANHFDGGLLIGDAGSFVDPMTGEGITQGMESALIGAAVLRDRPGRGPFRGHPAQPLRARLPRLVRPGHELSRRARRPDAQLAFP